MIDARAAAELVDNVWALSKWMRLHGAGIHLPFNGELSPDELRMIEQHACDGPASWEAQ